jgi:hypothetical protein
VLFKERQKWVAWFRAGTRKLRGTRKGLENGRCPVSNAEDAVKVLLKCPETRKLRENLSRKWQIINEEVACK